jgi:hypothetical protein
MHRITYVATAKVPKHANNATVHLSHGLANEARIPGVESWRLCIEPHLIETEPSLSDRRKACIGRADLISTMPERFGRIRQAQTVLPRPSDELNRIGPSIQLKRG